MFLDYAPFTHSRIYDLDGQSQETIAW